MSLPGSIRFCAVKCFCAMALGALIIAMSARPSLADVSNNTGDAYQLEKLTVSAQKREENIQQVPGSVTALNDVYIADAGIDDLTTLSSHVPGLVFYDFGSRRHSSTFMRGIKSLNTGEPATGYYVDGVNYSKSYMFDFPLFDIERIEVLKGPQGTLYGRNTMGGVINVYTKQPDNETRWSAGGSVGNENLREVTGFLRTPLVKDRLFLGFSGMASARDGFMENDYPAPGDDGRHKEGQSGRLKLRYLPTPTWDITLSADGQHHDDGGYPFRLTSRNGFVKKGVLPANTRYHYSHDFEGTQENDYWGLSLNAAGDLPIGRLTSVTGYRDFDSDEFIDTDFSPLDMMRMNYVLREKSFSQELRLASPETDGPLKWLAGVYYFHLDNEKDMTYFYRPGMIGNPSNPFGSVTGRRLSDSDGSNEGVSVFGQTTWTFLRSFDLTLGLRYEYEEAEMDTILFDTPDGGGTTARPMSSASNDFSALLPKIGASWHMSEDHMLYATFAGAHRSGGFNASSPAGAEAYGEEYSLLYEAGIKFHFTDHRLTVNLAVFYTDIDDEQITLFNEISNQPYVANAGESHRSGVEAEIRYMPIRGLDLSAGITVIEAQYDEYADPAKGIDYGDNDVFGVPEYTFNAAAQYRRPLMGPWSLFSRVDVNGVGNRYFNDANSVKGSPYALVDLKIGVEGEHADVYLWSKNLLDRHYVLFENADKGFAEDGDPMAFGMTLNYRY